MSACYAYDVNAFTNCMQHVTYLCCTNSLLTKIISWYIMSNTPERSVLRSCYKDLVKEITDPNALAVDLYSQGVLTASERDQVTQATLTTSQRNEHLLRFLEARVASDREAFDKLVSILESEEAYSGLARKLKEKLKELNPPASGSWCSIN